MSTSVFYFVIVLNAVFYIPQAIARRWPGSRNVVAFVVACVSSFSLSFAADIVCRVILRDVSLGNAVNPIFTWTGIGIAAGVSAFLCAESALAPGTPYCLNALFAAAMAKAHIQNLYVGLILAAIGVTVVVAKRMSATGRWGSLGNDRLKSAHG